MMMELIGMRSNGRICRHFWIYGVWWPSIVLDFGLTGTLQRHIWLLENAYGSSRQLLVQTPTFEHAASAIQKKQYGEPRGVCGKAQLLSFVSFVCNGSSSGLKGVRKGKRSNWQSSVTFSPPNHASLRLGSSWTRKKQHPVLVCALKTSPTRLITSTKMKIIKTGWSTTELQMCQV